MEITRREAMTLAASAAVLPSAVIASEEHVPLHHAVKMAVDGLEPNHIKAALDGTYAKVFKHRTSVMQIERVAHVQYLGLSEIKNIVVRDDFDRPSDSLRFVYNFEPYEYGLGFAVVEDDDPRAGRLNTDREPTLLGIAAMKMNVENVPWRRSDVPVGLARLIKRYRDRREIDAASILNTALTYDPSVVGDGRSLVSAEHPYDGGMWSNRIDAQLAHAHLEGALQHIRTNWVDERGLRIMGRGRTLVVPTELADAAAAIDFPHIVWDHLTNPNAWFVATDNDGLVWFERDPFELEAWRNHEHDMVMVKGYERRCFGCSNPRAILGSFPT